MFWRAVVAFLAMPGAAAFLAPALFIRFGSDVGEFQPLGLLPLLAGAVLLLWCVRDFYVTGKGTLAPWAPPRCLVVVGLYRYSRNPMYVAVAVGHGRIPPSGRTRRGALAGQHAWTSVGGIPSQGASLALLSHY